MEVNLPRLLLQGGGVFIMREKSQEAYHGEGVNLKDWTFGYVADIGYTFGYYPDLNPLRTQLAFLTNSLVCPNFTTACELGFGQGVSTNFHAAGSVTQWYGTDFNPSQAGFAQELAGAAGTGAMLYDQAFEEFATRTDLPDFDYIGLHGIWSWISDENRSVIVDFIGRKLKVGGVLYISYNTLPGWASFAPIRHLMTEHAEVLGAEGRGIVNRIDGAIDFAEKLLATNPLFSRANPLVAERVKKLKEQNRHYLAHEYFNRDWLPIHFSTMTEWLKPAKLQFACSANYLDHINAINLSDEQQTFLNEISDPMFHQSVRDFMVNQQFRKDYWVKGARRLSGVDQAESIRQQRIVLTTPRVDVPLKVRGALGDAKLNQPVYGPILDFLADHKTYTIGQIEQAIKESGVNFAQLFQAIMVLIGSGHLAPAQDETMISKVKDQTDRINEYLRSKSQSNNDVAYLVSPVTCGGVDVNRFQQLFLSALAQGKHQPGEWAEYVWQLLQAQGQRIAKEGKTFDTPEENLAELNRQAIEFLEKKLPVIRALQVD